MIYINSTRTLVDLHDVAVLQSLQIVDLSSHSQDQFLARGDGPFLDDF